MANQNQTPNSSHQDLSVFKENGAISSTAARQRFGPLVNRTIPAKEGCLPAPIERQRKACKYQGYINNSIQGGIYVSSMAQMSNLSAMEDALKVINKKEYAGGMEQN